MSQAADEVQVVIEDADHNPPRPSSIKKPPMLADSDFDDVDDDDLSSAFDSLPEEIIQQ